MDRMTTVGGVDMAPARRDGIAPARASRPAVSAPAVRDQARRAITVGIGCGVPCLSLALSSIGGRLCLDGHYGLGSAALGLCCAVLAVSLSHLAWAVRDITQSAWIHVTVSGSRVTPLEARTRRGNGGGTLPPTAGDSGRRSRATDTWPGRPGGITAPISHG